VKRGQEESDLERIQDLFPNDCLRLYDKDVITMVSLLLIDCSRLYDRGCRNNGVHVYVCSSAQILGSFQPLVQWIVVIKEAGALISPSPLASRFNAAIR
jgi:hypothetical protein